MQDDAPVTEKSSKVANFAKTDNVPKHDNVPETPSNDETYLRDPASGPQGDADAIFAPGAGKDVF